MHLFWPKVQVWWILDQNRFGSFSASLGLGSIQRQQHTYKPIFWGLRSPATLYLWESETAVRKLSGMPQQRPQSERRSAVRCLLCCVLGVGGRRWQLNVLPVSWSQCQGACVPSLLPARSAAPNQAPHSTFRNFSVAKRNRSPDNCRRGLRHRCGGFVLELVFVRSVLCVGRQNQGLDDGSGSRFHHEVTSPRPPLMRSRCCTGMFHLPVCLFCLQ